jgi:D-aminopeptidase
MDMNARFDQLFEPYRRDDAPGCVVGVARRGELLYRAAFGMANVEHGVAMTPATRMPLASITKHFTCAAVLGLGEQGEGGVGEGIVDSGAVSSAARAHCAPVDDAYQRTALLHRSRRV